MLALADARAVFLLDAETAARLQAREAEFLAAHQTEKQAEADTNIAIRNHWVQHWPNILRSLGFSEKLIDEVQRKGLLPIA